MLKIELEVVSVSAISGKIRLMLESSFSTVRVKGEISQSKTYQSGTYFTLKEGIYSLECVAWKVSDFKFEDGTEVICTGRISCYGGRSRYQLNVNKIEYSGIGAILKAIEERKRRLEAEGLFDVRRKALIPKYPKKLGMITSSSGAVLHDMIHRLTERYPMHIILYPIPVQGSATVSSAISALKYLDNITGIDVIVLARGGGSFEDLLPFQSEEMVRAVANCRKPVVTAIGHETDTTLVDYASSMRAPTPTAAIELITPVKDELLRDITRLESKLLRELNSKLNILALRADKVALSGRSFLQCLLQKLDYLEHEFNSVSQIFLQKCSNRANFKLNRAGLTILDNNIKRLKNLYMTLIQFKIATSHLKIRHLSDLLTARMVKPGTCIVKAKDKTIDSRVKALEEKDLCLYFHDGIVEVTTKESKIVYDN